jgi:hypothetical protein
MFVCWHTCGDCRSHDAKEFPLTSTSHKPPPGTPGSAGAGHRPLAARACPCARPAGSLVRRCMPRQRHMAGKQRPNRHPHHGPASACGAHRCGTDVWKYQKMTGKGELSRGAGPKSDDIGHGVRHLPLATRAESVPEIPICCLRIRRTSPSRRRRCPGSSAPSSPGREQTVTADHPSCLHFYRKRIAVLSTTILPRRRSGLGLSCRRCRRRSPRPFASAEGARSQDVGRCAEALCGVPGRGGCHLFCHPAEYVTSCVTSP